MADFPASVTCTAGSGVVVIGSFVLMRGHLEIPDNVSLFIAVGALKILASPVLMIVTLVTFGVGTRICLCW